MQSTHPIRAFFIRLAIITVLLLAGDYLDFIALTKSAIHATGQALADLSSDTPTQTARGG